MNYDDLNPKVKAMVDSAKAKEQGKLDPHEPKPLENEADFQRQAEAYLELCGFRRRTPREIQRHHSGLWYVHIVKAKRNPILLDLLLIDSSKGIYGARCLEIELKVGAILSVEQKCLVTRSEGVLAYSMDEFKAEFLKWRTAIKKGGNK